MADSVHFANHDFRFGGGCNSNLLEIVIAQIGFVSRVSQLRGVSHYGDGVSHYGGDVSHLGIGGDGGVYLTVPDYSSVPLERVPYWGGPTSGTALD